MKKLILILGIFIFVNLVYGAMQTQPQPPFVCSTTTERDTIPAEEGMRCFCKDTNKTYIYIGTAWQTLMPEGGSASWGAITGTLSAQTDVSDAIGSKTTLGAVKADTDVASTISLKHSNSSDHAPSSDNQDLSGLEPKQTGKSLSTNDLTSELKSSYDGAVSHAGSSHAPSVAEQNVQADWNEITDTADDYIKNKPTILTLGDLSSNAYAGDKGKTAYDHSQVAHAPSNAQVNADITKAEIEAKLTGAISSHTHAYGQGDMILASVQSVTGLKTFDTTKFAVKGSSTGTTAIASANASATAYTATLPAKDGTIAMTSDVPATTWKTGITTRDITTASGTVNVAHGLGRVPKVVRVKAKLYQVLTPPVTTEAEGTYDGVNHAGLCTMQSEGTTVISVDYVYSSTAFELGFGSAYNVNPYTGVNRQTATITCDATNIIFTWTKTGTVATAVANIKWEVN